MLLAIFDLLCNPIYTVGTAIARLVYNTHYQINIIINH